MANKQIGVITHWFDKIGVAVIKLSAGLKVGDTIKIVRGDKEFEQKVDSLQIDHAPVDKAKKGDDAALKLTEKAHEGAEVYKA